MRLRTAPPPGTAALAIAVAGLGLLAAIAHGLEPPLLPVRDAPTRDGSAVTLEGRLVRVHVGARGYHADLVDATGRIALLGRGGPSLQTGDDVRVRGVIGVGPDGYVVSVDHATVVAPSPGAVRSVAEVAHHPERFVGGPVALRGVLRDGHLRDPGGGGSLTLEGVDGLPDGEPGVAEGTLMYRPSRGAYALRVHAWRPL